MPLVDTHQSYTLLYLSESEGQTVMTFQRSTQTCDDQDIQITVRHFFYSLPTTFCMYCMGVDAKLITVTMILSKTNIGEEQQELLSLFAPVKFDCKNITLIRKYQVEPLYGIKAR